MAANLQGMLTQINEAMSGMAPAQGNAVVPGMVPRPQDTINPMLQQGIQGLSGAFGEATGIDMGDNRTSRQAYAEGMDSLKGVDLQTSEGLAQAASVYQQLGIQEKALSFANAAAEKRAAEAKLKQEQTMITSLSDRALAMGMDPLANTILSGAHPDLKEAAKEIRAEEKRQIMFKAGEPGRRRMALDAGFTTEEYERDLKGLTNEDLLKVLDGQTGTIKAFMDASGNEVMLAADKYGRVWKDGKRYRPEELGLKQAPQKTQEVITAADELVKAMVPIAAADIDTLHTAAKDSVNTLQITDRALSKLNEGTATGFFAPAEIALGRVASELGIDGKWASEAANAQAYQATMGNQVAEIIKKFGSGTGLSDADREYALQIAGGDVKVDESTLRWLLNAQRLAAKNILAMHGEVLNTLSDNGLDPTVLKVMQTTTGYQPNATVPGGTGLSESAKKYF